MPSPRGAISSADQQALQALPDSYEAARPTGRVGRDAILRFYSALPFAFNSFELVMDEADGHGDMGYVRGHYMVTLPEAV
jgi:hypothetical protein